MKPRSASPVVRELFTAMKGCGLTYRQIARRAGMNHHQLPRWKHGISAPKVTDLENIAEVVGLRIVVERGGPRHG